MAKFKVGDVLDRTGNIYPYWSGGGYVVYEMHEGVLAVRDDDGDEATLTEDYSGLFTARRPRPDPLEYLKATIRSFVGATSADAWAKQAVLIQMAKEVYGLDTLFVPATAELVPVTQ